MPLAPTMMSSKPSPLTSPAFAMLLPKFEPAVDPMVVARRSEVSACAASGAHADAATRHAAVVAMRWRDMSDPRGVRMGLRAVRYGANRLWGVEERGEASAAAESGNQVETTQRSAPGAWRLRRRRSSIQQPVAALHG